MMFAVDTNILIAYLNGERSVDTDEVDKIVETGTLAIPCVVLAELYSALDDETGFSVFEHIWVLYPKDAAFWMRVAKLRRSMLLAKRKARLADTMIAQLCLDYDLR
jgi:predicted nucleic acid-binding protein